MRYVCNCLLLSSTGVRGPPLAATTSIDLPYRLIICDASLTPSQRSPSQRLLQIEDEAALWHMRMHYYNYRVGKPRALATVTACGTVSQGVTRCHTLGPNLGETPSFEGMPSGRPAAPSTASQHHVGQVQFEVQASAAMQSMVEFHHSNSCTS